MILELQAASTSGHRMIQLHYSFHLPLDKIHLSFFLLFFFLLVSPSFILPVPPARKLRIGYHLMRRHALHTLGASDPGGLIGGEHTDVTELNQ